MACIFKDNLHINTAATEIKRFIFLTTSLQRNKLIHGGYDFLDRLKRG